MCRDGVHTVSTANKTEINSTKINGKNHFRLIKFVTKFVFVKFNSQQNLFSSNPIRNKNCFRLIRVETRLIASLQSIRSTKYSFHSFNSLLKKIPSHSPPPRMTIMHYELCIVKNKLHCQPSPPEMNQQRINIRRTYAGNP